MIAKLTAQMVKISWIVVLLSAHIPEMIMRMQQGWEQQTLENIEYR